MMDSRHSFLRSYYTLFIVGILTLAVLQVVTIHRSHSLSNQYQKQSFFEFFLSDQEEEEREREREEDYEDDDNTAVASFRTASNQSKTFFDISPYFAIHVIGERHSGVDWVTKELDRCFGHAIHVSTGLVRSKYWWQSPSKGSAVEEVDGDGEYGIVVALFRNPYDWVEAMRLQPIHAIDHFDIIRKKPLDWEEFLSKPWTVNRAQYKEWMTEDLQLLNQIQEQHNFSQWTDILVGQHLSNIPCSEDFSWLDVVPCSNKDRLSTKALTADFSSDMLYELQRDGSGLPYDNIMQLRRDKILHYHHEVSHMSTIEHYLPHLLEDLIARGTQQLLESIEHALPGIQAKCVPTQSKPFVQKILPYSMIDHINSITDWETEKLIGYVKLSEKDLWDIRQEHDRLERLKNEALEEEKTVDNSTYGIHIIGERHTGTLWLQNHLEQCFGNQIKVYQGLSRYKYWFQLDSPRKDYGMVIATFRNVYDWVLAMIDKPLHAPQHYNGTSRLSLPVSEFLEKKWSLNKQAWESLLKDDYNTFLYSKSMDKQTCYDDFTFLDVSPCSYNDRLRTLSLAQINGDEIDNGDSSAVYEMRRDHPLSALTPYDNILKLRRDKMVHFASELQRFSSIQHYVPIKFEDMQNIGTANLIKDIETRMGIQSTCNGTKLQDPKRGTISYDRYSEDFVRRINKGVDWDAESLVGYKKVTRDKSQYGIHIIGERHTGTRWLYRHIEQCFGSQIKVYERLSRHKYWFQADDESKDYGLVISTSRNVYDWVYSMMKKPLHAPIHYNAEFNTSMSFEDFIRTEWAPDRERWNQLGLLQDDQKAINGYTQPETSRVDANAVPLEMRPCYDGFKFFDVIPCSHNDRMRTVNLISIHGDDIDDGDSSAVYEMKKTHPLAEFKPYKNILELRRDKLINFHSDVSKFLSVEHFIPVKFEDMVENGTASILQDIEIKMGLKSQCTPDKLLVQDDEEEMRSFRLNYASHLNHHVDWSAESLVGYEKPSRDKSEFGIHIIGERHTGTSWLQQHLDQCFGDQVKVYDRLSRHKYWFQFDDKIKDYGLVIATFRNVYEWIDAMRRQPLHAPMHYHTSSNKPMNAFDFISTEWIPPRDIWDKLGIFHDDKEKLFVYQHANDFRNVTQGRELYAEACYDSFTFFDVVPCSYHDRERSTSLVLLGSIPLDGDSGAVYEMKKNHTKNLFEPYRSITSLRRDKMINFFQEVQSFSSIKDYMAVKFEDLVDEGTSSLIEKIKRKMNLQSRCSPINMPVSKKIFSTEYIRLINDRIDWSAERLIGYEKFGHNTSGYHHITIVDEKATLPHTSSSTYADKKPLNLPKDDPILYDYESESNTLEDSLSDESRDILKFVHLKWHPQYREERFPSVDERVKLYMSNWFDSCQNSSMMEINIRHYKIDDRSYPMLNINPERGSPFRFDSAITCDEPIMLDRNTVEICASNDTSLPLFKQRLHGCANSYLFYCQDSLDLINRFQEQIPIIPLIVQYGDVPAHSRTVPILSKYRMRALNKDSLSRISCTDPYLEVVRRPVSVSWSWDSYYWDATPVFQPIIWNLNRERHFGFELNESRLEDIPWESKFLGSLWIGDMNGGPDPILISSNMSSLDICLSNIRCRFVYQHRNSSIIHASLTGSKYPTLIPEDLDHSHNMFRKDLVSKKEILQYKVIISLEGNDVSSGLKWALLSNSVVMMPMPTVTSWLMEELLEAWVHYIPLKYDGSDAEEMIRWVGKNDLKARRIAERGRLYMYDLLYHPDARRDDELVKNEILQRYKRFWSE